MHFRSRTIGYLFHSSGYASQKCESSECADAGKICVEPAPKAGEVTFKQAFQDVEQTGPTRLSRFFVLWRERLSPAGLRVPWAEGGRFESRGGRNFFEADFCKKWRNGLTLPKVRE